MLSDENNHEDLFRAHWELTSGGQRIHKVASAIYSQCRHSDARKKFADVIITLEEARDLADQAWKAAEKARTQLIQLTGCDGSCSDRAKEPEKLASEP